MIKKVNYNNDDIYIITDKKKYLEEIDELINKDYIIIYDGDILDENPNTWVLASNWKHTNKEYYRIVKTIFPYANIVYNMCEVGIL